MTSILQKDKNVCFLCGEMAGADAYMGSPKMRMHFKGKEAPPEKLNFPRRKMMQKGEG